MIERVLLVAWKGAAATSWAAAIQQAGYRVFLEDTTGERAWRTAKERGIDVVIIDGQKKPSHGRNTGHMLRDTAKTRHIPIVWTNLNPDDAGQVQQDVQPDVLLTAPTDALQALAAVQYLQDQLSEEQGGAHEHANGVVPSEPPPVKAEASGAAAQSEAASSGRKSVAPSKAAKSAKKPISRSTRSLDASAPGRTASRARASGRSGKTRS